MGKDMKPASLEELIGHICPDITIRELFDLEEEDSRLTTEEVVRLFEEKFKKVKLKFPDELGFIDEKFKGINLLHSDELRAFLLQEINNMQFSFETEVCKKINILVKAAFILGSNTTFYEFARITRLSKILNQVENREKERHSAESSKGGKKPKRNPLMISAIVEAITNNPNKTQQQIIATLVTKANNNSIIDGHYILFFKKGNFYNGKKLKSDCFVFDPVETTELREFKPLSKTSVARYIGQYIKVSQTDKK